MYKQLLNAPEDAVEELVQGLLLVHPNLTRLDGLHVLLQRDYAAVKASRVTLISGGGSGHEPSHAGWVGSGMLTAAVAGGVFASPSVHSILSALRAVTGPHGCLIIVKNYTGDRLNFGLACEIAKSEGLDVRMVIVGDDCGIAERPEDRIAGRRGLAGTCLVHKIAGAAAAAGATLDEVAAAAAAVAAAVGTVGVALDECTLPGKPKTASRLAADEMEMGLGIHGEPGAAKIKVQGVDAVVDAMLDLIRGEGKDAVTGAAFLSIPSGSRVALLVNNLGATPTMQLYIAARRAVLALEADGVAVERVFVGSFMTALDMRGLSTTLLKLDAGDAVATQQLAWLDAATGAAAWPAASTELSGGGGSGAAATRTANAAATSAVPTGAPVEAKEAAAAAAASETVLSEAAAAAWSGAVRSACVAVLGKVDKLTEWDRVCGDGDCGDTFGRGANELIRQLDEASSSSSSSSSSSHPVWLRGGSKRALLGIADAIRTSMGGTSGVVLDIFFRAVATSISDDGSGSWAVALRAGIDAVSFYGGAKVGMRTLLDALDPACAALESGSGGEAPLRAMAAAALAGAEATQAMSAIAGRSSYVRAEEVQRVPDPGAMAIAIALGGAAE